MDPIKSSSSKEEYFPVFQSNSRDLQLLEASVVNDITQFYTYMKAQRDAQRRLAETKLPQTNNTEIKETGAQKSNVEADTDSWRMVMLSVIYLTFLGYESARKAIGKLVEYQPARAERLIVILLTDSNAFPFCASISNREIFDDGAWICERWITRSKSSISITR